MGRSPLAIGIRSRWTLGVCVGDETASARQLLLADRPDSVRDWLTEVWRHRETLGILTRKDFQTRYKRASFGVVWAIAVPALQASIMAIVFSRVVKISSGKDFVVYVISGVVAYSYFSTVLNPASTAIVDGAGLTDKVWFPRALLVIVPCLSNLVGLITTTTVLVVAMPLFHVQYGLRMFLLLPAVLLLVTFAVSLSLVLAALHVYFRDVRFLVQAALLVWLYVTPILYPEHLLGHLAPLVKANPLTGIVGLFHYAVLGHSGASGVELAVSLGATGTLLLLGAEVQRRYDRLFVDLL
jgi:ABC-type polysaccharide/polyol phosphate export permease